MWNKIYLMKNSFWKFYEVRSEIEIEIVSIDTDSGPLWYVLWCFGSISKSRLFYFYSDRLWPYCAVLHTWWFGASMRDRKLPQSPTWCFQGCTNFWPFLAYIQRSIVAWPVPELAKWTPYGISGAISRNQVQRKRDTIWSLLFHNFLSCTRRNTCNIEKYGMMDR